jgi:hypothetical protein
LKPSADSLRIGGVDALGAQRWPYSRAQVMRRGLVIAVSNCCRRAARVHYGDQAGFCGAGRPFTEHFRSSAATAAHPLAANAMVSCRVRALYST